MNSNLNFIKSGKGGYIDYTSAMLESRKYSEALYKMQYSDYEPIRVVAEDITKQNAKSREEYAQRMARSIALEMELKEAEEELARAENTLKDKENTLKDKEKELEEGWIKIAKIFAANSK